MSSALVSESLRDRDSRRNDARRADPGRLWRGTSWLLGWSWRVVAGTFLCFNAYLLSYLTSIVVVGWLTRWVRGRVLYGWWKQSPLRQRVSFEEFAAAQGGDVARRPRWLLPEKAWTTPALWLNFRTGFLLLLCIYLVLGWGCVLLEFGWEYRWNNSFAKGYEQALIGPLVSVTGLLLFIAALFYVPMAQVHVAASGDCRAFFRRSLCLAVGAVPADGLRRAGGPCRPAVVAVGGAQNGATVRLRVGRLGSARR